jgi:hypothetical protein
MKKRKKKIKHTHYSPHVPLDSPYPHILSQPEPSRREPYPIHRRLLRPPLALSPLTSPADGALPCPQSRRRANTSRSPAGAVAGATAAVQDGGRRRRTGPSAVRTSGLASEDDDAQPRTVRHPSEPLLVHGNHQGRRRRASSGTPASPAYWRVLHLRGHGRGRVLRMGPFHDLQDPSPTSTLPSRSHPKVEIFASRARVDTIILYDRVFAQLLLQPTFQ